MIHDKNIVLTGASSGIGLEVLKLLYPGEGNRILAVSRHAEDVLADFADNVIPFNCDVSSAAGVDAIFEKAAEVFEGKKIDLFYANAGFPYYEAYDYTDWGRILKIFETNTISPIYTYSKYLQHLDGRSGHLAYTVSAIGQMAMPGYALYSATKFALHGFQQAMRVEKPANVKMTCLYPIATNTNFFKVAAPIDFEKPFPVQEPDVVARKMVAGLESGKKYVFPSGLFTFAKGLMAVVPPVRTVYWKLENNKLDRFKENLRNVQ
ncbi:MAG: SDR family NAD(P)-dependent oxidoreductase [Clostridia bacterium]|nr:SDR family NAD(P)-dependent oxidoreductase [Clostridia bacterium]MBR0508636.1 SDR family NAD(P)-dependent oxidoreductase [Clostridia bacterium]